MAFTNTSDGRCCVWLRPPMFVLFLFFHFAGLASAADIGKYNAIIDRRPFGSINTARFETQQETNQSPTLDEIAENEDKLAQKVKLTAITSFGGETAAGFLDLKTGHSFLLKKGQKLGGYELLDVEPRTSSVLLTSDEIVGSVRMSFAKGQATNISVNPISGNLAVMDVYGSNPQFVSQPAHSSNTTNPKAAKPTALAAKELISENPDLSDKLIKAATIKNPDGTERISFRELHRLRMEENRKAAEEKRRKQEEAERLESEKIRLEKEMDKIAAAEENLEEKLIRKALIGSIVAGETDIPVEIELTEEEAETLANAGFDTGTANRADRERISDDSEIKSPPADF